MTHTFKEYLIKNTGINTGEAEELYQKLMVKHFGKGDFLLREGEHCQYSFFVEEGLLRVYTIGDNGKEHIIQFAPENWFCGDRSSVYFNEPSEYFVEAIEDSRIVMFTRYFFGIPTPENRIGRYHELLLNNHIRHLQKRIRTLLSESVEKRYIDFISTYPDILSRIPQWMIASYLGVTPEGLSRVRKELAQKGRV